MSTATAVRELKMGVYEFGKQLIEANDLDPVYVIVAESGLDCTENRLERWLLAYWCFYHVGTASWCVEPTKESEYWTRMMTAASSSDYPRSPERRHFRAKNAISSVNYLASRGVGSLFKDVMDAGLRADELIASVKKWVGFGPWIAFKVADMVDRIGLRPVKFDIKTAMYEGSPMEGAEVFWYAEHGRTNVPDWKQLGGWAVDKLLNHPSLRNLDAPPRMDRKLGPQEAETILCKWKSYLGGHYEIGEDIAAVRRGLLKFSRCKVSQILLKAGKRGGLW